MVLEYWYRAKMSHWITSAKFTREKIHLFIKSKLIHHPRELFFLPTYEIRAPLLSQSTLPGQYWRILQIFIASGVCLCTDGLEHKTVFWSEFTLFFSNPTPVNGSNTMFFSFWGAPQDKWDKQTFMHTSFTFILTALNTCLCKTPQRVMDCDNL